jgi:cyclopropane-fatty-acyl-phospholipid synthase
LLAGFLNRLIKKGRLTLVDHKGATSTYGDGDGPEVAIRFTNPDIARKLVFSPSMAFGEGYMDGDIEVLSGDIYAVFELLGANLGSGRQAGPIERFAAEVARIINVNNRTTSRKNVAHHYDISNDLYRRFLDADMQYSCAYFAKPGMSLEDAQEAKKAHIAAKLRLEPGHKVLDIGCGWGGLALAMARYEKVDVTGVTLSVEQRALAEERASKAKLKGTARFELRDYRDITEQFDRIVSVGMFEHVGQPQFQTFFDTAARLLKPDGVMLLHSIGRTRGKGRTDPWIAKYIFPGGYIPSLSEVMPHIEASGLIATDIEILRLHYADTCREWRKRFRAQWDEIARDYDERFCRMFDFYLAGAESTFRHRRHMVFQVQLTRRIDAVPMTRDYIAEAESKYAPGLFM